MSKIQDFPCQLTKSLISKYRAIHSMLLKIMSRGILLHCAGGLCPPWLTHLHDFRPCSPCCYAQAKEGRGRRTGRRSDRDPMQWVDADWWMWPARLICIADERSTCQAKETHQIAPAFPRLSRLRLDYSPTQTPAFRSPSFCIVVPFCTAQNGSTISSRAFRRPQQLCHRFSSFRMAVVVMHS